jgi:hypothetical protein
MFKICHHVLLTKHLLYISILMCEVLSKVLWLITESKVLWLIIESKVLWLITELKVLWLIIESKVLWLITESKVLWLITESKVLWLITELKVLWLITEKCECAWVCEGGEWLLMRWYFDTELILVRYALYNMSLFNTTSHFILVSSFVSTMTACDWNVHHQPCTLSFNGLLFNNQPDALFIQIYSVIKLYVFRATSLPIVSSLLLYVWHW